MEDNKKMHIEALATALQNEIDSYEFYKMVEEKVPTPLTKKTFHFLAEQELQHMEKIKEFDHELSDEFEDLAVETQFNTNQVKEEERKLFNTTMKELKEKITGNDELEPYELGLDIESDGFKYYKKAAESADDLNLKKFLTFLMREEQLHYALIQNTMNYIKDPENFMADEEDWTFEG